VYAFAVESPSDENRALVVEELTKPVALTIIQGKRRNDMQGRPVMTLILIFCILLVIGGMMKSPVIGISAVFVTGFFWWERRKLSKSIANMNHAELMLSIPQTRSAFLPSATKSKMRIIGMGDHDVLEFPISKARVEAARNEALPTARIK
jgi:hypothetical protein